MNKIQFDILSLLFIALGALLFSISYCIIFPSGNLDIDAGTYRPPQLHIGCNHIVWEEENTMLRGHVNNFVGKIRYSWWIDSKNESNGPESNFVFSEGVHTIRAEASNESFMLEKEITITAISSTQGITVEPQPSEYYGTWKFQTYLNDVPANVPGTLIMFDDNIIGISEQCKLVSLTGATSGTHIWSAQYHGQNVSSDIIEVPAVEKLKISNVKIAPKYETGDTISTELVVINVGTVDIDGFKIKTLIINNNYAWMGDKAKREYSFDYSNTLRPGETAKLPIETTIPEKVNGIRPTGTYTINLEMTYSSEESSSITLKTKVV